MANTSFPILARQIQSDLWASAAIVHTGSKPTFVHKQKSSSGTWEYTIEDIEGVAYEVTRFNGTIVDKSVCLRLSQPKSEIKPAIVLHA